MRDNEEEAKMQAALDQCWKDIEERYSTRRNGFFKELEFFHTTGKPNTPQSLAVLCISLVGMQIHFNGYKKAIENENQSPST